MLVVLQEEVVNQLLHVCNIPIVYGIPSLLNDGIDFKRVGCVSAWLVGCGWIGWSLYGLHGLCVLLLDGSVDVGLAVGTMEPGCCSLLGLLAKLLVLSLKEFLVLLVQSGELYL